MRVQYMCKYCKQFLGELNQPEWSRADAERACGINRLNAMEQTEVVDYNGIDESMQVKTVCDYCQNAVELHPELLVEGKLLQ